MGSYKVIFNESANHELASIDRQFIARILAAIEALTADPFPPGHRKIRGKEVHELYQVRVGRYRVIYTVDLSGRLITIYRVRAKKGKKTYKNV